MGDCRNTILAEYATEEPCEFKNADCIVYTSSLAYLNLEQNSTLSEIIVAYLNSLINTRTRVQALEDTKEETEGYTFATLPTSPVVGEIAHITDADTISYRANAVGGGSSVALVMFDGTNWIYH